MYLTLDEDDKAMADYDEVPANGTPAARIVEEDARRTKRQWLGIRREKAANDKVKI